MTKSTEAIKAFAIAGAFAAALFTAALLTAATAAAAPPPPYNADNTYIVTRGDDSTPAGTHSLRFYGDEARLTVVAETRATMLLFGLIDVPFIYDSRAVWEHGALITLSSSFRQSDDGKKFWLRRDADKDTDNNSDGDYLTHSGARVAAPLFPTNHWNIAVLRQTVLFNTLSGNLISVRITPATEQTAQTLNIGGADVPAQRYNVDGDLTISLWYGDDGKWLQLEFAVFGTPYRFTYQPPNANAAQTT